VVLEVVKDDSDDNRVLECAVAAKANYIISGDKHLLDLGEYRGIEVLPPAGFIVLLSL
jgi:predicted nucleic acid-binding protein